VVNEVLDDEIARLAEEFGGEDVALDMIQDDRDLIRCYVPPQ
jgi:hypothetical protein